MTQVLGIHRLDTSLAESPILEARDAQYSVRGTPLVHAASLTLRTGEMTVVIGPNGAGKSTLLKLLSGELAPDSGTITSFGMLLAAIPAWRLACRRAVMAQASRLSFPFAVHEVVRLGLEGLGRAKGRREIEALVERGLEASDMLALAGRDYQTLSGGEQQRVQFARVLCQLEAGRSVEPQQILFLDEPIASLDLCHQLAVLDAARAELASGATGVLAVLHDLNLAATYADTLVVMDQGQIVATGTPQAVLTPTLLRDVFRVEIQPGALPPAGMPFFLPQLCRRSAA